MRFLGCKRSAGEQEHGELILYRQHSTPLRLGDLQCTTPGPRSPLGTAEASTHLIFQDFTFPAGEDCRILLLEETQWEEKGEGRTSIRGDENPISSSYFERQDWGSSYLGDSSIQPHQYFINFINIFPCRFVLTVMCSRSTMQQVFTETILCKARKALVMIIKIILTRQEHFVVICWNTEDMAITS